MITRPSQPYPPAPRRSFKTAWDEIHYLHQKADHWLRGPRRPSRALAFAERLAGLLRATRGSRGAILGQESWALVCEVRGDLRRAIHHHEQAIALIARFLALPECRRLQRRWPGTFHEREDVEAHRALIARARAALAAGRRGSY